MFVVIHSPEHPGRGLVPDHSSSSGKRAASGLSVVFPALHSHLFFLAWFCTAIRSSCAQGCFHITPRLPLDEEAGRYLGSEGAVALAAGHCYPHQKEHDVQDEFWWVFYSQWFFSLSLFPVAESGSSRVCMGRGQGEQIPGRGVRGATRWGDPRGPPCPSAVLNASSRSLWQPQS